MYQGNEVVFFIICLSFLFILLIKFAHWLVTLCYFMFIVVPLLGWIFYVMITDYSCLKLIERIAMFISISISLYYLWWEISKWKCKTTKSKI